MIKTQSDVAKDTIKLNAPIAVLSFFGVELLAFVLYFLFTPWMLKRDDVSLERM